jgi:monovalent cation:H+ antiporter-2, CPA2 family
MSPLHVLIELVVVLGTAAVVTVAFQALRLPVVLGYVLAGLLIGPHVPVPLVADAQLVHLLSDLGVILLMFTVGLELPLATIRRVGAPAALTAVFEVGLVIALGSLAAMLLGFDAVTALFAGACLGISSTMLVAKAFEELGWKGGFTEIVFAILVFEDLIAILLLAILAAVARGSGLAPPDVVILLAKLGGFLALMLIGGLIVVPRGIRWIATRARSETLLIGALAVCIGTSALAAAAGYSVALGAFVAGVLIAESGHGHAVFEMVKPFRDVFAMVFFVSIGMTIEPAQLGAEAPHIAVLSAILLLAKPLGVALGTFFAGHGVRPAVRAGITLAQVGELSFVMATIAPRGGDVDLMAIAVGIACVTTFTSSVLIRSSEPIASWVAARLPRRIATFVSFYDSWFARLRSRERATWKKFRRPVFVVVFDAGVITAIAIVASAAGPQLLAERGLTGSTATGILVGGAVLLIAPFAVSLIRRTALIARRLAIEVIPVGDPVDLGRAPRRVLVVTFELAMALAIAIPISVVLQPFVPGSLLLVVVVALVLLVAMRRSMADFEGHVRAGSELILELLAAPAAAPSEPPGLGLAQLETILPGFGGLSSVTIDSHSAAAGRSLAELDLRAKTGATVLAIGRGAGGLATPSPTEPLRAGDVLALAGSDDEIAAARTLLSV